MVVSAPIALAMWKALLSQTLRQIEENDTNYAKRYDLVLDAMSQARSAGYAAGVRIDSEDTTWPVFYIELPTGQVSWHMPEHKQEWDGHDTPEKYRRCRAFGQLPAEG